MNVAEYHADGVEPAAANFDLADLKGLGGVAATRTECWCSMTHVTTNE